MTDGKGYKVWNYDPEQDKNIDADTHILDANNGKGDYEYSNLISQDSKKSKEFINSNPHLNLIKNDHLYHLGFVNQGDQLAKQFGHIKFVLMGGTARRMKNTAILIKKELSLNDEIDNLTKDGHRYNMYKIGSILCVNHGIGHPSLTTLLHEIFKLLVYAKCKDVTILRLGTCGAISKDPGTVIVSNRAVDEQLKPYFTQVKLGKTTYLEAKPDEIFLKKLKTLVDKISDYKIEFGTTLTANDFYEGQGRLDGIFCDFSAEDVKKYKEKLKEAGVVNIEMEAVPFMAFCSRTNFNYGIINVVLVDRFKNDQIKLDLETLYQFEKRPALLAIQYIKNYLNQS